MVIIEPGESFWTGFRSTKRVMFMRKFLAHALAGGRGLPRALPSVLLLVVLFQPGGVLAGSSSREEQETRTVKSGNHLWYCIIGTCLDSHVTILRSKCHYRRTAAAGSTYALPADPGWHMKKPPADRGLRVQFGLDKRN